MIFFFSLEFKKIKSSIPRFGEYIPWNDDKNIGVDLRKCDAKCNGI